MSDNSAAVFVSLIPSYEEEETEVIVSEIMRQAKSIEDIERASDVFLHLHERMLDKLEKLRGK